ncbi:MAG: Na+/H+ antiporter NhaC family protein, partial [Clostridia bacterium]|nr:Na+/H+ antiporter NhaC family protein [Clostridia bacterium]
GIFIFLVLLGMLVALLNKTGASASFGKWAQNNIKTRVGAALATFLLGVLIFIDDYFNCLTVGSVMQPVTDSHKISRAKLAFLIDATAAPICMIAPISSWAAAVSEYADGTGYNGLELFIRAIPYNFYSLLTLAFIVMITLMKFDFGPMAIHEKNALEKGDLFTSGTEHEAIEMEEGSSKGKVLDLILPIVVLIVISVIGLLYVGGMFAGETFVDAFANTDATVGLPWGGTIALVITIIYLICRKVISFKAAMECIPEGFKAMVPAILILSSAGALKNMTTNLGSDVFVESIMADAKNHQLFLPAIIFIVACFIAFSTGTSWGTFGILIPIVTSIFPASSELMYIGMSACLAGAVCGDHCSPISDTTIMSSAGARCDHINHVSTQIPYAITVAAVSFFCYILTALLQTFLGSITWLVALPVSVGILFVVLLVIKKKTAAK